MSQEKKKATKRYGAKMAPVSKVAGDAAKVTAKQLGEDESLVTAAAVLTFEQFSTEEQLALVAKYKVKHIDGKKADMAAEKAGKPVSE